ncbi:hypothetical protein COCMIDRAFT_94448, partial [Bipolaris oryzae ATCC 44560]
GRRSRQRYRSSAYRIGRMDACAYSERMGGGKYSSRRGGYGNASQSGRPRC